MTAIPAASGRSFTAVTERYPNRVLTLTLTLALVAHLLIIFGVRVEPPVPDPRVHSTVEVVVVRQPEAKAAVPDRMAAPAQHTQRGSGQGAADSTRLQAEIDGLPDPVRTGIASLDLDLDTQEREEPPPEPFPPPQDAPTTLPEPEPEPTTTSIESAAQDGSPALTATLTEADPFELAVQPLERATAPPPVSAAAILASRNQELARLAARVEEHSTVFADRPRRTSISSSTKEYKYATYLEGWRRKVEQIGNLNYPEEARRKHLYGNLILRTAVRADGSVEQIQVIRSSGHLVLDQAAVHIVELAAPFAPFPPDIAAETDVLDITRTWQFQRNNRLGWGN